jgi:hypothetical protein
MILPFRLVVTFWLLQRVLSFTSHPSGIRTPTFHVDKRYHVQRPLELPSRSTRLDSFRTRFSPSAIFGGMELKNLFYDDISMAFDAWEVSIEEKIAVQAYWLFRSRV